MFPKSTAFRLPVILVMIASLGLSGCA